MVRDVRVHRADQRDVVNALGRVRENLADRDAALPVALELVRTRERRAGLALGAQVFHRQQLAGVFLEGRLGVERVDMRRAAVEKIWITRLALGRKCAPSRRSWMTGSLGHLRQHRAKRQPAHADPGPREKLPPCQEMVTQPLLVMLHRPAKLPSPWLSATPKYDYDHCIVASRTRQWFNRRDVYREPIFPTYPDTRRRGNVRAKPSAAEQKLPNILWITSEDNGAHLGCYGDPYATSPNIDRLAKRSLRYTNARLDRPGLRTGAHDDHLRHLPARDRRRACAA